MFIENNVFIPSQLIWEGQFLLCDGSLCDYGSGGNKLTFGQGTLLTVNPSKYVLFSITE